MRDEEIVEVWKMWFKAIEEGTAVFLCRSCKEFKPMTNPRQITIRMCDKCMEGVKIPTF